ncbi:MAG: YiiX family permuted papain-like enzyme [Tidjanibacter sp.]|nr:YiiX family permuted papain-like enzyme [Tidjanibacter sp.]
MNRKYLFAAIMSAVFLCAFAAAGFRVLRQNPRYAQKRACREVETMQQEKVLRDGDLIFQTSLSGQSRAIQEATGSKYSHCGIIYRDGCDYFVYEAVQSVKSTPLAQWIARGKGGHYVVKRLAGADSLLTERNIAAMRREAARFAGRDYDLTFGWSDDRLYCSELIWKIYDRTLGIRLGNLQRLGDFDLSAPAVREKLAERYGAAPPLDEPVISPAAIFDSPLLVRVTGR